MSWDTQAWAARQRPGSASAKLVLLGLASCAGANHEAYPSIEWLCTFSALNRKTVISALQRLEDDDLRLIEDTGHRRGRTMQVKVYRLRVAEIANAPDLSSDPAGKMPGEGPKKTVPKKEQFQKRNSSVSSVEESQNRDTEYVREPITLSPPDGGDAPLGDFDDDLDAGEKASPPADDKPHRLADDWEAPKVDDLQPEAKALVSQWPAGAYAVQCAKFVNHWTAINRAKRTTRGWQATLSNWMVSSHAEVMRAAKAGVSFAALAPSKAVKVQPITPVRAKSQEDDLSKTLHATIRSSVGESIYGQWFACCALLMDVRKAMLTVVTPSPFAMEWIEQHHRPVLERIAHGFTNGARANITFRVERKKPNASTRPE